MTPGRENGPIWTFSLRGVLTFVASGLDINGCVLSYFEGTVNLHCYTNRTLTTLHCSIVSFLQCCHMKRYKKIFTKMWGVYSLLWDLSYSLKFPPIFKTWLQPCIGVVMASTSSFNPENFDPLLWPDPKHCVASHQCEQWAVHVHVSHWRL